MPSPARPEPVVTMQSDVELPEGVTPESLSSLAAHVLSSEGVSGAWPLGIHFVDDPTMQAAHVEFMDIDEPTDIMTFPYADDDGDDIGPWVPDEADDEGASNGGDLLISVDRAAEHATEAGWPVARELYFLVAHGILHLLGWDDATGDERRAMLERQSELLSEWSEAPEARH